MYVTTRPGSSGKCAGGGGWGAERGREELPRHQGILATTTAMAMAMATRTSKSDSFDEELTTTTLLVQCTRVFPLLYKGPSYPARANVSYISFHNLAYRFAWETKKNASTRELTGLLAGPIFLLFLRPPESNRSRRVNQSICERFFLISLLGQRSYVFSYTNKCSLKLTQLGQA